MAAKRIIIAGGGTGGHIFPAISIGNALKKLDPNIELLFVGAKGKMEMEKIPQAGFNIKPVDIAGFNRSSLIKNIGLPFKLVKSLVQVRKIINEFKPDAVLGVGGYSSYPVLRYAQAKGISTFIHESNSFAGKSNILLGKKAIKIFVATDGMEKFFSANRIMITGNPVRASIVTVDSLSRRDCLSFFGLQEGKKTLLIVGGSLGAKSINEAVYKGLDQLLDSGLQLIWQTGKPFADKAREKAKSYSNIWVNDFITQMEKAYAASDLVVSRSGAMAMTELCIVKKPVVFVPYPFAAEDHQTMNALNLVNKEAALMVKDNEANEKLVQSIIELAKDEKKQEELKNNISQFAIKNADIQVAQEIINSIR